jgi:NAD-dependent DNA ligase/DNA polymerase/3'-5' exonuclease PolX
MNSNTNTKKRYNEDFINILEQLANLMSKKGEVFRAKAYQKAVETIMTMTHQDITSVDQLKSTPSIGKTIYEKLEEFCETGTIELIEVEKSNPVHIFSEVYGIGPKKAQELVTLGITSIAHLRSRQNDVLNNTQRVGLRYYENILQRIPRSEIDAYKKVIQTAFDHFRTNAKFEIVGSYRRGAETSGDIDVILTCDDPSFATQFIQYLVKEQIILEVLSQGPSKCLVIAKLFSCNTARRVDFLFTDAKEFPFAILYFTGSKIFNTVMRHTALTKGFTMNEHGIFDLSDKTPVKHAFHDEKDIFDFLGLVYKQPNERIDGRAIQIKELHIPHSPVTLKKHIVSATASASAASASAATRKRPLSKYTLQEMYDHIRLKGQPFIDKLSENQMASLIQDASDKYYNTSQPPLEDKHFDLLQGTFKQKYPNNKVNQEIGAPVTRNKVDLPYFMGSMDKIKLDPKTIAAWSAKYHGPYIISCKLDGISGLFSTEGPRPQLFTRGNGTVGQDVSHLIPHLRAFLPVQEKNIVIRGEFIIPRLVFDQKYKKDFANPRNMVAGIINQKGVDSKIADVHFVSYEVIKPVLKPYNQMKFIKDLEQTECVHFALCDQLNVGVLSETLIHWRANNDYEIDGVIVTDDHVHERKTSGNPDHAFAFKMQLEDQVSQSTVVDVIWTPSKDGYLKPRVRIQPIHLGGVCIEWATGFNAAFIVNNGIGVGSEIELVRSGDVIHHINKVITKTTPMLPNVPFVWNATNVDILLENADEDDTVISKNIAGFFKGIEVDGLGSGIVAKLIYAGFDTVPKIIHMSFDDFLSVEGFKDKMAHKIYDGIRSKLEQASIVTLMAASNIFGRGFSRTKLELILTDYPDVLVASDSDALKIRRVASIKGMASKTAEAFVTSIKEFCNFLVECNLESKLSVESLNTVVADVDSSLLYGKSVVLTGFRSKPLEEKIKAAGGKIGSSVTKSTLAVITKDLEGEMSGKLADAQKHNVPIMTQEEFEDEYFG